MSTDIDRTINMLEDLKIDFEEVEYKSRLALIVKTKGDSWVEFKYRMDGTFDLIGTYKRQSALKTIASSNEGDAPLPQ